jgi:hypothetical protein
MGGWSSAPCLAVEEYDDDRALARLARSEQATLDQRVMSA